MPACLLCLGSRLWTGSNMLQHVSTCFIPLQAGATEKEDQREWGLHGSPKAVKKACGPVKRRVQDLVRCCTWNRLPRAPYCVVLSILSLNGSVLWLSRLLTKARAQAKANDVKFVSAQVGRVASWLASPGIMWHHLASPGVLRSPHDSGREFRTE